MTIGLPSCSRVALAPLLLLCQLAAPVASAQEKFLPPAPIPKDITVRAERGETIAIPLESSRSSTLQLKFLLRSRPKLGELGEVKLQSKTKAVIPYTVSEGSPTGTDTFKYALQGPNTAVSVPGTVQIMVVDPPAELSLPENLDFPPTAVGDVSVASLKIRNSGRGPGTAKFDPPEPWKVMGPATVRIPPEETVLVRIAFSPQSEIAYRAATLVTTPGRETVVFTGKGVTPLSVTPQEIVLRDPESPNSGTAGLTIRNHSQAARLVTIDSPPEVTAPAEVSLPPGETTKIEIKPVTDLAKRNDTPLSLSSAGWEARIPVKLFAIPGELEITPNRVDLGEVRQGVTATADLTIRNAGGTELKVDSELPASVNLTPPILGRRLAPQETLEVKLEFVPPEGFDDAELLFTSEGNEVAIPLLARTKAEPIGPEDLPRVSIEEPGSETTAPATQPQESMPPESQPTFGVGSEAVSVIEREPRRLVLAWKLPDPAPQAYKFEVRKLESVENGQPTISWEEFPNAEVLLVDGFARAEFTNLSPGEVLPIRMVPMTLGGTRGAPSGVFRLSTPHPTPLNIPWLGILLTAALLVLLGSLIHRKFIAK